MRALLFLLLVCLLFCSTGLAADGDITADINGNEISLTCNIGHWASEYKNNTASFSLNEDANEIKDCGGQETTKSQILIRIRTCDNCIELDILTMVSIALGNVLATIIIGVSVYCLVSQPKAKSFSGNKASDKVNLISHNGDGDMYQPLSSGQVSEYSTLGGGRRK